MFSFRKVAIAGILTCALVLTAPSFAFAATYEAGACDSLTDGLGAVVDCIISILQIVMTLIIAASVVYIVYGAFLMISSEEKREGGKQTIYYGIIGLFVMVSIWGLVAILTNTFNLDEGPISPPELQISNE